MRYVPGPGVDETLALIDANGVSYAMNDQRNTPSAWADASGNPNVQLYGAFGEEGPANTGRIGFTGQMRLPELGLAYYKARFYDPAIGRFLTPDPAGYTDSPNLYAYVLNDPVNLTDPSGLYLQRIGNGIFDCRRGAGGAIGDDEPRYGPVTCSYLYSVAYEADTSNNPGSGFRGSGGRGRTPPAMGMEGFVDKVIILYCNLPNLGSSGSIRAYDGIGGGVAGDVAFGPQSGRIAVSFGIDVGVGFGGSVGFSPSSSLTVGRNVASGISASIGVNANVRGGPYAGGGSATLIGRNGPGFGGFSAGLRPGGTGVSANANVGGRVGFGLQILPACPTRGR